MSRHGDFADGLVFDDGRVRLFDDGRVRLSSSERDTLSP
jgi:hypothetical protein